MQLGSGRRRVVVTGVGLISALGDSVAAFGEALRAGTVALGPVELFPLDGLPPYRVGEVKGFDPARYFGDRNYRPLDRNSRLATVAGELALVASGLADAKARSERIGLVLGTMFGSVRTIAEFDRRGLTAGPSYVKPLDFANSVINAPAGQTAIWHGLTGVNSTITGGATAGVQAIAYAADLIRAGHAPVLVAGGSDELSYESLLAFDRAGLLHPAGAEGSPVPFGRDRAGFALGEGAALLVLEELSAAERRGAPILAEVAGHASAFDTSLGTRENGAAEALARAIRLALADAGVEAAAIGAVSSGASGSVAGDRAEALGIAEALGENGGRVAVTAVKAHLGETLGASGGFQAVALLGALASGTAPGIPGLESQDPAIPLALGEAPRPVEGRQGLVTALGLDGQTCAVVLSRLG